MPKLKLSYNARLILLLLQVVTPVIVYGQKLSQEDSISFSKLHFTHNKFVNNIFKQALNSMQKSPADQNTYTGKSEDPYMPYEGRIIRHIYIEPINFNRSFKDTSKRDNSFGARAGNRLHKHSRRFVIRDNVFIEEHQPLNAYKLADNERYIRSRAYIHDARIIIDTLENNPDSVDITIFTQDLFSIGGGGASNGFNHVNLNLYDANLAGLGQQFDATGIYDYNRTPIWGYGAFYRKYNIMHSFTDVTVGYSTMNISGYTHEEETTRYFSLGRQLISPYSRFAGGLTLSRNDNYNPYHIPDSISYLYKYDLYDGWAGYNIGIKLLTATNNTIRDRRFFALRYYKRDFQEIPYQVAGRFDPVFNSSQALLGQFTFFRQDYFKTQYIYGFGTTEDLPYGYNLAVTGGWHKQLNLERPYAGISASEYVATHHGDFIQFYLRSGGFLFKNNLQDGSILLGTTVFSRLFFLNSTKIRQYINVNYTYLGNRVTYAPLKVNNFYGIRGFLSDSAYGSRRFSLQLETEFYIKFKLLGFQFAPFPYCDMTVITPEHQPYYKSELYTGLGGGFRTRNENLTFGTIEVRAFFFPVAPNHMTGFKVVINSNIQYRYNSNYITPPELVRLNDQ